MKQPSKGDMRRNPEANPGKADIDRLLQLAAYYQGLGCVNVAISLRDLAEAKRGAADGRGRRIGPHRPMRE